METSAQIAIFALYRAKKIDPFISARLPLERFQDALQAPSATARLRARSSLQPGETPDITSWPGSGSDPATHLAFLCSGDKRPLSFEIVKIASAATPLPFLGPFIP